MLDKFGRKPMLCGSFSGMFVSMAVLSAASLPSLSVRTAGRLAEGRVSPTFRETEPDAVLTVRCRCAPAPHAAHRGAAELDRHARLRGLIRARRGPHPGAAGAALDF